MSNSACWALVDITCNSVGSHCLHSHKHVVIPASSTTQSNKDPNSRPNKPALAQNISSAQLLSLSLSFSLLFLCFSLSLFLSVFPSFPPCCPPSFPPSLPPSFSLSLSISLSLSLSLSLSASLFDSLFASFFGACPGENYEPHESMLWY